MNINTKELRKTLNIVINGIATDDILEQGTSYIFNKGKISTYNNEVSISHPFDLDITGAIEAKQLFELVNKIKSETIDFEIKDKSIILKSGRSTAGFNIVEEIKLPIIKTKKIKWLDLPSDFIEKLLFTASVCSSASLRPILTTVSVNGAVLTASDSLRLIQSKLEGKVPTDSFLLPQKACKVVGKIKPSQIAIKDGWVHLKTKEGTIISCRTLNDKYPNVENILTMKSEVSFKLPKDITDIVNKATIFSSLNETGMIDITIKKNTLTLSGKSDSGWFKETVDVKSKDIDITFSLYPNLLTDMLEFTTKCQIDKTKIKFSRDNWQYIGVLKA